MTTAAQTAGGTGTRRPRPTVGLVAGGLGAYWPQFPDLLPQLRASAEAVSRRMRGFDAEVVDTGFVSDAEEGRAAADRLRAADCDLIVCFLTTYMTSSMVAPIAQRCQAPVLFVNLQPTESMDHAAFDTGQWLAYCGACPLPEMANLFERLGVDFRSVSATWRTGGPGSGSAGGSARPGCARPCATPGTGSWGTCTRG